MDQSEAINRAEKFIQRISDIYNVEKAYLFGSYANNSFHKDSDIDLAVVINSKSDILEIQIKLMSLRNDEQLIIEPHPFFSEKFNENIPSYKEIMRYGIELKLPIKHGLS